VQKERENVKNKRGKLGHARGTGGERLNLFSIFVSPFFLLGYKREWVEEFWSNVN